MAKVALDANVIVGLLDEYSFLPSTTPTPTSLKRVTCRRRNVMRTSMRMTYERPPICSERKRKSTMPSHRRADSPNHPNCVIIGAWPLSPRSSTL